MRGKQIAMALAALFITQGVAIAETRITEIGGDTFVSGETVSRTVETSGDVFVAGRSATVLGSAEGDFHASGFDVVIGADTKEDAYAAGFTVTMKGAVGQDLSAAAFTLRTESSARVAGNARLAGATVVIDGPIDGALTVMGRDVVLNAPVQGEARITASTLTFGPEAQVSGQLVYSTPTEMEIPERVAPASQVTFQELTAHDFWEDLETMREMPLAPDFATMFFGFLVTLLFFILVGAIALGFFPKRVAWMRKTIGAAPGRTLLQGVIGLSVLFGIVPVTGLTIVGLLFVPIALLAIVVFWTLAYALGAYAIAMYLWVSFGNDDDPKIPVRLAVFAVAIIVVSLLNFIPFVGWVANYTLVLLGIGAMTHLALLTFVPDADPALDVDLNPIEED